MSKKIFLTMSLPALALAAWMLSPGWVLAQHHGGGHGSGFHAGGGHAGGFHARGAPAGGFHREGARGFHRGEVREVRERRFAVAFWPWFGFGLGWGYFPWYYGYYYPWSYGYSRVYEPWYGTYYGAYEPYYYGTYESYPSSAETGTYTPEAYGYYELPPGGATAPAAKNTAFINVLVPADAQVWFEGVLTKQQGSFREFESPPLIPGKKYSYDIRAQWKEGDHWVTQTRHIDIRAGDRVTVDFTTAPEASKTAPPKSSPPPSPAAANKAAPATSAPARTGKTTPSAPPPPPRPPEG